MSNPDMLHAGCCRTTTGGRRSSGLRYVVLDEVHTYRGVFGSHVANVLRRLKRVCRFHGSNPQFILSSATVANPAEHAASLLAGPVAAVTESGAPRGRRRSTSTTRRWWTGRRASGAATSRRRGG
ncbi:MAG: DEAD/DEAH box helicase [bacterium]